MLTSYRSAKHIAVIGLGYVGLPLALLAEKKGYKVTGIIRDPKKAQLLNQRVSPIKDRALAIKLKNSRLNVTTNYKVAANAEIIIICVPTPVFADYTPNFGPIKSACTQLAAHLTKGSLVILESTVNPGVCEEIVLPILEKGSGLKGGQDFDLAHCPERINPGDPKWHVENINRVVGSLTETGLARAVKFYKSILTGSVKSMASIKEAEAVKIVENSFRDINIAFVNELAISFERLGIDIVNVIQGASTKPFSFLPHYPGCGVGGHCIPVDPYYLIEFAKRNGFVHDFLMLARKINNSMPAVTVDLVLKGLNQCQIPLKGTQVAVLGLAFKPNIDDDRESPAYKIIKLLQGFSAEVVVFDPLVTEKSTVKTLSAALKGSKAVVIATAHRQFLNLNPQKLSQAGVLVLIDGRNCLSKASFQNSPVIYKGIGR